MAAGSTPKQRAQATPATGGLDELFRRFAQRTSHVAESAWAFIAAVRRSLAGRCSGPRSDHQHGHDHKHLCAQRPDGDES